MMFFRKYWGCHQKASRSFFIFGYQFPLCARCAGILLGEIIAILSYLGGISLDCSFAGAIVIPTVIDGVVQLRGHYESNNTRRIITGVAAGYGGVFLVVAIVKNIYYIFI